MIYRLAALAALLSLAGCANNWTKYYHGLDDARTLPNYDARESGIRVFSTSSAGIQNDIREMIRHGYAQIGYSNFNAGSDGGKESQLRVQAQKIGAQVVITGSSYTGTVTGSIPWTTPTTSTSYTTGQATAYGRGGPVTAYGSATTTTYGSQTTMIPYSVNRSDFGAAYFFKSKYHTGVYTKELSDETRRAMGSNKGVLVDIVVDGSPAFMADIIPGDVIISINDAPVFSPKNYSETVTRFIGTPVSVRMLRGTQELTKTMDVLPY